VGLGWVRIGERGRVDKGGAAERKPPSTWIPGPFLVWIAHSSITDLIGKKSRVQACFGERRGRAAAAARSGTAAQVKPGKLRGGRRRRWAIFAGDSSGRRA
jgi:hypothetical protein